MHTQLSQLSSGHCLGLKVPLTETGKINAIHSSIPVNELEVVVPDLGLGGRLEGQAYKWDTVISNR